MTKLAFLTLKLFAARSITGSFSAKKGLERALERAMDFLVNKGGYGRLSDPRQLRTTHLEAIVKDAKDRGLSQRSVHNLLSKLRILERAIGKPGMLRSNEHYCGPAEPRYRPENRTAEPDWVKWSAMPEKTLIDRCAKASAALAMLTGIRLITAIRVDPNRLESGLLQTRRGEGKGTRANVTDYGPFMRVNNLQNVDVFIRETSREIGNGALIPTGQNYIKQARAVEYRMKKAGLSNPHSYRHGWARDFYDRLVHKRAHAAGIPAWKCPVRGGPASKTLIATAARIDNEVRQELSHNLGHTRIEITKAYIG